MPDTHITRQVDHYETVAEVIRYLRTHARAQPSLKTLAENVGLSEYHLQRTFSEWVGISPKRFLQYLTKEHAMQALRESEDVLSAALQTGLSGAGRLHDLMVSCEAMTPGEIKAQGEGLDIHFGSAETPFGMAMIAWTKRGICYFGFMGEKSVAPEHALQTLWPRASLRKDTAGAEELMAKVFPRSPHPGELHLLLQGTNFQIKVWEALLRIPPGQVTTYSHLANMMGMPKAHRAVGTAIASNIIGYLIPCHRVIREGGEISCYRWGKERKAAMLAWESSKK